LIDQVGEDGDGLGERGGPVVDVGVVEVDVVGAEAAEAVVEGGPDGRGGQAFSVGGPGRAAGRDRLGPGLGGQDDPVPGPAAVQPASEQPFALVAGAAAGPHPWHPSLPPRVLSKSTDRAERERTP
jgi:hypothetical protein